MMHRYRVHTNTGCNHALGAPCARCEAENARAPAAPRIHTFYAGAYEHLDTDPVQIDNPQQLRDECAARGLTSKYMEETETWRKRVPRWS
jgi:hypothetical protein